jgi:hypothetical protein
MARKNVISYGVTVFLGFIYTSDKNGPAQFKTRLVAVDSAKALG